MSMASKPMTTRYARPLRPDERGVFSRVLQRTGRPDRRRPSARGTKEDRRRGGDELSPQPSRRLPGLLLCRKDSQENCLCHRQRIGDSKRRSVPRLGKHQPVCAACSRPWCKPLQDADLLILDAQYDEQEYVTKKEWGHSSCFSAADLAIQARGEKPRPLPSQPRMHRPRRGRQGEGLPPAGRPVPFPPSSSAPPAKASS